MSRAMWDVAETEGGHLNDIYRTKRLSGRNVWHFAAVPRVRTGRHLPAPAAKGTYVADRLPFFLSPDRSNGKCRDLIQISTLVVFHKPKLSLFFLSPLLFPSLDVAYLTHKMALYPSEDGKQEKQPSSDWFMRKSDRALVVLSLQTIRSQLNVLSSV